MLLPVKFFGFLNKLAGKFLREYEYISEKILQTVWQKY